jgi:hypothetical protein
MIPLKMLGRGTKLGGRPLVAIWVLLLVATLVLASSAHASVTIETFTADSASPLAGAHSDVTTAFQFEQLGDYVFGGEPAQIIVKLPPGLVGDPQNVPRCPRAQFDLSVDDCPADSQVGVATINFTHLHAGFPEFRVYNVQPGPDEPAMLGIQGAVGGFPVAVPIRVTASTENNYALKATTEVQYFPVGYRTVGADVTLWGVPASHARGTPSGPPSLPAASPSEWKPFMQNPTGCDEAPVTDLRVNTSEALDVFSEAAASSAIPTDCSAVPFAPAISLKPETEQAGAPTGLTVTLAVPQGNASEGRGTAELEKAIVTLPAGMTISPSAASKPLEGCTSEQFATDSDAPAQCPAASVIGEDEVESPLLPTSPNGGEGKLTGKVYLGQPLSTDPTSGQMFRVFQELQGFGLDVKIAGSVVADPVTGQLTATFANLPELPFQTFRLHFNGGPNAVLVNPPTCGPHTTTTQLYPYSNPTLPATPSSTFETSYDGDGAPCPSALPFAPSASISTASTQAGASSPLTVSFSRGDGTQALARIDAKLPDGLLGYVSKVPLCQAAEAIAGTCSAESRIGTISTSAGAGSDPLTVQGSVYLARGADGYPFMLSVVVPAVAGPYNLGNVVVPVWLQVNSDGSITAVSGALPSILDGIPLDIRSVSMTLDRPGFTFNPTSCAPLTLTGNASSLYGIVAPISAPFQVNDCGTLPFAPSFTVASKGSTSKANGASLAVRIEQKPGEADIHSVHVELPVQLPSRLTTLQQACTEAQFTSNPASCPRGSVVGSATAITPTLASPLSGPAILVSHGGAAFPDLEIILQGEGVSVVLDGETDIKKGITSSTFTSVPDVPIGVFALTLPEGPYSLLSSNAVLCTSAMTIPTTIIAQSGTTVSHRTKVAVTGCSIPKPTVTVVKTKAKKAGVLVTVKTTVAGTVSISGVGLATSTERNVKAGTRQIDVAFTNKGTRMHARHETLKLRASLISGKRAVVAKTTSVET